MPGRNANRFITFKEFKQTSFNSKSQLSIEQILTKILCPPLCPTSTRNHLSGPERWGLFLIYKDASVFIVSFQGFPNWKHIPSTCLSAHYLLPQGTLISLIPFPLVLRDTSWPPCLSGFLASKSKQGGSGTQRKPRQEPRGARQRPGQSMKTCPRR